MTIEKLLVAVCRASDSNVPKVGLYQPAILKARKDKRGLTTITFALKTDEFTPDDVLSGLALWLAIGTCDALKALPEPLTGEREERG